MKKAVKTTLAVAVSAAAVAGVASIPAIVSAWGDNGGMRSSHTLEEINEKADTFDNTPFFNTISNSVIGDEKNFVGAREDTGVNAGAENKWQGNNIDAEDGKTYLVRIYAHNNNPHGEAAVAENTRVSFTDANNVASVLGEVLDSDGKGTGVMKQQVEVQGVISSSNSNPTEYWDHVDFNSDHAFHLEYVYGSALLENNGFASTNNIYNVPGGGNGPVQLSDNILSDEGVLIGYYGLDGRVPGCYQYANYVTIKVKVVYDYDFTVEKKVRLAGDKEWKEEVDAKVGDKVEFRIEYKNTSDEWQNGVALKDTLPANLRYVSGSAEIKNASHPQYETVTDDYIVTTGLLIGDYSPNSNAFLRFTAEVVDDNLACGKNLLINWAQAGVGNTTLQDDARVNLNKVCDTPETPSTGETTPTTLPTTGPEAVAGGIIATSSVVTAAGYYIASRRQLR